MQVPIWLLVVLVALILFLGLLLYSARVQRDSKIRVSGLQTLDGMFHTMEGLTGSYFVEGNSVELLFNGDGFFPELLEAIEGAEQSVHIETFAWWKGKICQDLSKLLAAKAEAGVEVRLLLDYVGASSSDDEDIERMEKAGVCLTYYRPPELRALGRLNQRTHRKLTVVDSKVGFIFGHGFAEEWEGDGKGETSWSDTGAKLRGPIVTRIQAAFARQWVEETAEVLAGEKYFPQLESAGDVQCQIIASLPSGGVSPASLMHKLMLSAADRELLIQNPYFCPDDDTVDLLLGAVERGVKVRLMVPGPVTDSPAVMHAGHHYFPRLLKGGVEIWEWQPSLPHQKVLIVDREWCSLGSMNFDERSFDINAEIALGICDDDVVGELAAVFDSDLEHCERVSAEEWNQRSLGHRILDRLAYQVHEQL